MMEVIGEKLIFLTWPKMSAPTNEPSLLAARSSFACHTMNVNGENYIIVAGGNGALKSTEYLQKSKGQSWKWMAKE